MYRVLDLFSGIGGFSLGLERTGGFKTVSFCEIYPYCRKVLAKHWPDVSCHDDITTREFVEGEADVITGGFPCQDLSYAGKGAGLAGERSGLYWHLIRAIRLVRPKYALVENVAALLSRGLGTVLGDLAEVGYDAEWHCIPASAVGAPHRRDRVWIVANPRGEQHESDSHAFWGATAQELLSHTNGSGESIGAVNDETSELQGMGNTPRPERERLGTVSGWQQKGFADPSWWSVEPNVGRVVDGLSFELDIFRRISGEQGDCEKTEPETARTVWLLLRAMWECQELATASPELYRRRLRDCVPGLPCGDPQSRWLLGARIKEDQGLRDLWEAFYAQPFKEAQDLQQGVLERAWQKKRPEAVGSRVNRLRALGNAVVPQIPELIGRAILEAESVQ